MKFSELVDISELQELCQSFTNSTGVSTAILDLDGTILSSTGWREICTRFHRVHPESARRCLESDTILAGRLREGSAYSLYRCKNGLYDAAVPIMINDMHVANFFTGQFFLDEPDPDYFRRQAAEFGFDTAAYLRALADIPVYSPEQVVATMEFFSRLARIVGEMGVSRKQLEDINRELKIHQEHLVDLVRERTCDLNKAEEIAHIGSWKWDLKTGSLTWSDSMFRLLGIPMEERPVTCDTFLHCIHPEERERIKEEIRQIIARKRPFVFEFRTGARKGYEQIIRGSGEIRCNRDGEPVELFGTNQDITEEKMTEKILLDAKQRAEEANLAKIQFLSRMSHELRTPLNAILGYSQLFKKQPLTADQRSQIHIIQASGEHLLELINEILEVSRIEQKEIVIDHKPIAVHGLVKEILEVTRIRADAKGLALVYEEETPLPAYLLGDERRVREILLNLLSNAVKYTNTGTITLRIGYIPDSGGLFTADVKDTGIGIGQDQIGTIFLPFTQLTRGGSTADGVGLGLTIVSQLLGIMGGTITVSSEPGRGSRFAVTIPMQPYKGTIEASVVLPEIYGYAGERRLVLIADDNPANSSFLADALAPLGFETDTSADGEDTVRKANRIHPDLLLLDLIMPGMDGVQVIDEIRREPGLGGVKIIGISATVTENRRKDEFIRKCNDFLTKPVNLSLLLEKIGNTLDLTWKTREPLPLDGEILISLEDAVIPPEPFLGQIRESVMMGDFMTLERILGEIEASGGEYDAFISQARSIASRFDDEGILTMIQKNMAGKDGRRS